MSSTDGWAAGLSITRVRAPATVGLIATVLIAACGGYGGGSGNSYMPPPPPPHAAPASVTTGPVTGFGSVHLNGLRFDTTHATINIDGQSGTQNGLHVGHVIEVRGHHDSTSNTDVADEIEFRNNVRGAVSAVNLTAQTLVVLGQTVDVTADTSFDDDISPASLNGIAVGDAIEVSGMAAADGSIQATRIERGAAGASLQVIGTASATDPTAKTLRINALVVDFSAATLADFPASGPKDGDLVEATGTSLNSAGALKAARLELRTGKEMRPDADAEAQIEGLITRFASATDFDVAGQAVTTTASTQFEGGTAADLALSVRVEVEGSVNTSGVLTADKVHIRPAAQTRIFAQADSADANAGTITLLGNVVSVNAMTRFEDHGSQKTATFSLADVRAGDWLEIRATGSTGGTLTATRLDRRQAQDSVRLTGAVSSAAPPDFMILSTQVATTAATQFNHGLNATTFFNGLTGQIVSVRGAWNGTTLTATQAQIGQDEED